MGQRTVVCIVLAVLFLATVIDHTEAQSFLIVVTDPNDAGKMGGRRAKGGPMRKGKKNGRRPKRFLQDEQDEILQKNEEVEASDLL